MLYYCLLWIITFAWCSFLIRRFLGLLLLGHEINLTASLKSYFEFYISSPSRCTASELLYNLFLKHFRLSCMSPLVRSVQRDNGTFASRRFEVLSTFLFCDPYPHSVSAKLTAKLSLPDLYKI